MATVNEIGKHASVDIVLQPAGRKVFTFHDAVTLLILQNCFLHGLKNGYPTCGRSFCVMQPKTTFVKYMCVIENGQ